MILQFGAGNFLRAFADLFVQEMNDAGQGVGKIVIVQSTVGGRAAQLNAQGGRYQVLVRGRQDGQVVDRVQVVESIAHAFTIQDDWGAILRAAHMPNLRAILSNTTEAGFALDPEDAGWAYLEQDKPPCSFPARLLALLKARYEGNLPGVTVLPCELIEGNANALKSLVLEQAALWDWDRAGEEEGFGRWLRRSCTWVNTLVDRIVSGRPAQHPLLAQDPLLAVTEPFAFWAVEDKAGTEWMDHPAIIRVPDVAPYALRKVRILNGAHTALVSHVRRTRPEITLVREALSDPEMSAWLRGLIFEEILPAVSDRAPDAEAYAHQTLERFANPFLDHKLSDIALHHEHKVPVRLIPTRDEFVARFGRTPERLEAAIRS